MKTTISALRTQISTLEREMARLHNRLQRGSYKSLIRELNGVETVMNTPEDYESLLASFTEYYTEIARLKGIVNYLNNTVKTTDGKTIMEVVVLLNGLRQERNLISGALDVTETVRRRSDSGMSAAPAYYEVTTPNYDREKLVARMDELTKAIDGYENELGVLNNKEIEIAD